MTAGDSNSAPAPGTQDSGGSAESPDPRQLAIFLRMTPHQKLVLIGRLGEDAVALKESWLRQRHPSEGAKQIRKRLRAWQLYGRTDLV
jgi:hypothetical protein